MKRILIFILLAFLIITPLEALAKKGDKPPKPDKVEEVTEGSMGDLFTYEASRYAYEWVVNEGEHLPRFIVYYAIKIGELEVRVRELEERIEALEKE